MQLFTVYAGLPRLCRLLVLVWLMLAMLPGLTGCATAVLFDNESLTVRTAHSHLQQQHADLFNAVALCVGSDGWFEGSVTDSLPAVLPLWRLRIFAPVVF